ncbi:MAG TPA: aminoacyl-tRNA hydrolase [Casimicrobiaceae bacterium]|nr:aminoacyl-tRNA hydrolase [Casimicrobiaceae bacterium]
MAKPLRLIVGLGNPGRAYSATRHNAGSWFVERLAKSLAMGFRGEARFHSLVAGSELRLALPQTFMNRSGLAVAALARYYRIGPGEILIAHDELDLKPGSVKLKHGGGLAGHNGLKDIAEALATGEFWRLRIGIGHPRDGALSEQEVADYVLHRPSEVERAAIDDAIARALAIWPRLAAGETERAMHELHTRPSAGAQDKGGPAEGKATP